MAISNLSSTWASMLLKYYIDWNKLDFQQVFSLMNVDEILKIIVDNKWQNTLTNSVPMLKIALQYEIDNRHFKYLKLDDLRGDGLLTLMAATREGSILTDTAINIKNKIKSLFESNKKNFVSNRIALELYERDYNPGNTASNRNPLFAYAIQNLKLPPNVTVDNQFVIAKLSWANPKTLIDPVLVTKQLKNTPKGKKGLYIRCELPYACEQQMTFSKVPTSGSFCIQFKGETTSPIDVNSNINPNILIRQALEKLPSKPKVSVCCIKGGFHDFIGGSYKDGFGIRFYGPTTEYAETSEEPTLVIVNNTTGVIINVNNTKVNYWQDFLDEKGNVFLSDNGISVPSIYRTRVGSFLKKLVEKWFAEFAAAGGTVDAIGIDFEESMGYHDMLVNESIVQSLKKDSRWTKLATRLGKPTADDIVNLASWNYNEKAMHFAAVMMDMQGEYFYENIYLSAKKHFPDVICFNYDNYFHCQTVPCGKLSKNTNPWNSVGAPAGNCQSRPLYSPSNGHIEVLGNGGSFSYPVTTIDAGLTTIPLCRWRVKSIERKNGITTVIIHNNKDIDQLGFSVGNRQFFNGVMPGYKVNFQDDRNIAPEYQSDDYFEITSIESEVGNSELTVLKYKDPRPDAVKVSGFITNSSRSGWLNLHHTWNEFISLFREMRQNMLTSNYPTYYFYGAKTYYNEFWFDSHHYEELLLHVMLHKAGLITWSSSTTTTGGGPKTDQDDLLISKVISEVDSLLGYDDFTPMTMNFIVPDRQKDQYVITGAKAHGKKYCRVSLRPGGKLLSNNPAKFKLSDNTDLTLPGKVITIPNSVCLDGYWVEMDLSILDTMYNWLK